MREPEGYQRRPINSEQEHRNLWKKARWWEGMKERDEEMENGWDRRNVMLKKVFDERQPVDYNNQNPIRLDARDLASMFVFSGSA